MRTLLCLLLLNGCAASPTTIDDYVLEGDSLSVLFIGNSLTYYNELPAMIAALADSAGLPRFAWRNASIGGTSLEDHWVNGSVQGLIAARHWDFVVLQQGPSALESSRELLRQYVTRFDSVIRASGARTAVYQVWPDLKRPADFPRVIESFTLAAADVNALLLPAGEVWQEVWRTHPQIDFYDDTLHPTETGSYAVAAIMIQRLYGRDPRGLPARFQMGDYTMRIDTAAARVIQQAARRVHERSAP